MFQIIFIYYLKTAYLLDLTHPRVQNLQSHVKAEPVNHVTVS